MARDLEDIIDELNGFILEGDYTRKLSKLTDKLLQTTNPESALDAMFAILERYPEEELGSPGPLVHAIEKCRGYELALIDSVKRQPGTLSVWMLYRLIKYDPKAIYLEALQGILSHPKASEQTKEDAALILSWV